MKVTKMTWGKDQVEVELDPSTGEKKVHVVKPRETDLFGTYAKVEVYLEKDWYFRVREEVDSYHIDLPDEREVKPEDILEKIERELILDKYTKPEDQNTRGQRTKDE